MTSKLRLAGLLSAVLLTASACATGSPSGSGDEQAAAYPDKGKSIRLLIPYGAGGGTDLAGRLMASGVEKELGVKFVIENNPAGSGQTALRALVGAKPDGYTLAFTPLPATNMMYLDKERGATFSGSILAIAVIVTIVLRVRRLPGSKAPGRKVQRATVGEG
jgi:tripartite-type tricarboxylate transporter receptor subunit TctC